MEKTEKARKTTKRKCKATSATVLPDPKVGEQIPLVFPRTAAQKVEAQRIEESLEEAQRNAEQDAIIAIVRLLDRGLLRTSAAEDMLMAIVEEAREWEQRRSVQVAEALAAAGL